MDVTDPTGLASPPFVNLHLTIRSSMPSTELQRYAALRAVALAVRPELKPDTITVAVFRENEETRRLHTDDFGDEDFIWMRCSERTTLQVIHKRCMKEYASECVPPYELRLFSKEAAVHMANNIGILDTTGDGLVLLMVKYIDTSQKTPMPVQLPPVALVKSEPTQGSTLPSNVTPQQGASSVSGPYPQIVAPRYTAAHQSYLVIKNDYCSTPSVSGSPQPQFAQAGPSGAAPPPSQQALPWQAIKNEGQRRDVSAGVSGEDGDAFRFGGYEGDSVVEGKEGGYADDNDENDDQKPKAVMNIQLHQLFEGTDMKTLEEGTKQGLSLLDKLGEVLTTAGNGHEDADTWMKQIGEIKQQAQQKKTIVGVVGNTGAGKSSVINAILEEERLVPTNCMRACTAVVTEISYNHENDDPYRASIEFISAADWEKELRVLFQDLMDGSGEVKSKISPESEAGIAWAKIRAVYPKKTKEMLTGSTVESLLTDPSVRNILGTNRIIRETDSLRFYKNLQRFVDSKEKSMGDKKDRDRKPKEMDYWPLIRVVKLYVKSPTLATGAVIVDLPGVHDANAARAAVAESYMKKCTGLWIVAPITRAVDDKSAHKLMGESFRRQLQMDGGFSTISFICSKSDDISISEATLSLQLEDELSEEIEEIEDLERERTQVKHRQRHLEDTRKVYTDAQDELDELLTTYEELRDQYEAGDEVYAPKDSTEGKEHDKKRKRPSSNKGGKSKKARRHSDDEDSDFVVSGDEDEKTSDDDSDSDKENESEEDREPLTMEEIDSKIGEIKATKKSGREEKMKITRQILEVRSEVNDLDKRIKMIQNKVASYCILARNNYSTKAIQNDFASGLEELDREAAEDADGDNFDPEVQLRDYTEVASQLPVFCVSSRGYQKLKGRLKKDGDPPVFESIDQTGIPALQAHCTKLTEKGREMSAKRFLTNLSQFCNSLSLWSASDGTANHLSDTQKAREVRTLEDKFKQLDKDLDEAILQTVDDVKMELADSVFDRYAAAIDAAAIAAPETAEKWGYKINREDYSKGGYCWATYKAICRRDGEFSNGRGKHDLNGQLSDPMIKVLASGWERVFTRRLPKVFEKYHKMSKDAITAFHKGVGARARKMGVGVASLHLLEGQLNTYGDVFRGVATDITAEINTGQREINREFTPVIAASMAAAYRYCTNESGPGSFKRMKAGMEEHVRLVHRTMFEQSTADVKNRLIGMVKAAENRLEETTARIFDLIERDYRSIFGGNAKKYSGRASRAEDKLRGAIRNALLGFEEEFNKVASSTRTPDSDEGVDGVKAENKEVNNGEEYGNMEDNSIRGESE